MRRREFFGLVGGAAFTWSLVARAQQATLPVVGFLNSASAEGYAAMADAFEKGLKEAGYADGQNVAVTRHELAVLAYLALHAGKRRTVAEIFEAVWGRPFSSEAAYVWTYIRRLRRKVEPDPRRPVYLLSRGGLGYFLPPPDDSANC